MTGVYRASRVEPYSDGSFSVLVAPDARTGETVWLGLPEERRRHTLVVTEVSQLRPGGDPIRRDLAWR